MKLVRSLLIAALFVVASPALAQSESSDQGHVFFAVDVHPLVGLADPISGFGFGFDARVGYSLEMSPTMRILPEGVIGYSWLGSSDLGDDMFGASIDVSNGLFRVMGGARALFNPESSMRPSLFAHIGFGSFSTSVSSTVFGQSISASDSTSTGILDLGGAVDFDLDENLTLGGHVGLNWITAGNAPTFLVFGLQGTYNLY